MACRGPSSLLNFNLFGTFLPFENIRHFGAAHAGYGLCRSSPHVEIEAVELAAYGPDKLIHNICWFGLSHVELTAAVVVVWSISSCFEELSLRLIAAWYSHVRSIAFSPDNGTKGALHAWWRESNLSTWLSPNNETALRSVYLLLHAWWRGSSPFPLMILTNLKNVDWWCPWSRGYNQLITRLITCWNVADKDVSRRDSQMDDDTQWYREIHLRCSIEQKKKEMVGKVALMWPKCSRERWWWRFGWLGEWAGGAHNPCAISPDVITLTSWS